MKRILGIVGSPRRNGNTHVLVSKMLEGARGAGAAVETLLLTDLTIRECDGCHACWQGKECPKNDDMNDVYPRIADADVLIFGTPVYWYGPTALMKALIDRFVYFNCPEHRPNIAGKSAVIAVPFEETNPQTAAPLVAFFEKCFDYLEMFFVDKIIIPGVTDKGDILQKPDRLQEAYELGARLAS